MSQFVATGGPADCGSPVAMSARCQVPQYSQPSFRNRTATSSPRRSWGDPDSGCVAENEKRTGVRAGVARSTSFHVNPLVANALHARGPAPCRAWARPLVRSSAWPAVPAVPAVTVRWRWTQSASRASSSHWRQLLERVARRTRRVVIQPVAHRKWRTTGPEEPTTTKSSTGDAHRPSNVPGTVPGPAMKRRSEHGSSRSPASMGQREAKRERRDSNPRPPA